MSAVRRIRQRLARDFQGGVMMYSISSIMLAIHFLATSRVGMRPSSLLSLARVELNHGGGIMNGGTYGDTV